MRSVDLIQSVLPLMIAPTLTVAFSGPNPMALILSLVFPMLGTTISLLLRRPLGPYFLTRAGDLVMRARMKRSFVEVADEMSSAFSSVMGSAVCMMGALPLLLLGASPIPLIAAGGAGMALPAASLLSLYDKPRERKSMVDSELPFFATYMTIATSSGFTVYSAIRGARSEGADKVFPGISREAEDVERIATFGGVGVLEGLERHAKSHPHELYQSTMLQAASIQRTGGNVVAALEDRTREALRRMEAAFESYAKTVASIGEVAVILLFLLPISVALTAVMNPDVSVFLAVVMTAFAAPLMGFMLFMVVRSASPRKPDRYEAAKPVTYGMISALAVAAPTALLGLPRTVSVASGILAFSLVAYLMVRPQLVEVDDTERELRRFLRDVVELRRLGRSVVGSIYQLAYSGTYRQGFQRLLKRIAGRMSVNVPMLNSALEARSWLGRMVFFLLYVIEVTGGGSVDLIEKVIDALRTYENSRNSARSGARIFAYMAMFGPLIGAATVALVVPLMEMLSSMGAMLAQAGQAGFAFAAPTREQISTMVDLSMLLVLVSSAGLTVTVSRAVDMHPYGLHRLAVCAALAIAAYYALPALSVMMSGMLGLKGAMG